MPLRDDQVPKMDSSASVLELVTIFCLADLAITWPDSPSTMPHPVCDLLHPIRSINVCSDDHGGTDTKHYTYRSCVLDISQESPKFCEMVNSWS